MAWRCDWRVRCDAEGCGAVGPARRQSVAAEEAAVRAGWLRGTVPHHGIVVHLCPCCVVKGLPDWWPDYADKE